MITGLILRFLLSTLLLIVAALPVAYLPTGMATAFQYMVDSLYKFSDILPVTSILQIVGYAIAFQLLVFSYRTFIWIYNKLRGATGSK
jgi:hypothetical protein